MGAVAEAYHCRPSDYLPELNTFEKFCVDEVVAYAVAEEKARQMKELKDKKNKEQGAGESEEKPTRPSKQDSPIDVLNHEAFRRK